MHPLSAEARNPFMSIGTMMQEHLPDGWGSSEQLLGAVRSKIVQVHITAPSRFRARILYRNSR